MAYGAVLAFMCLAFAWGLGRISARAGYGWIATLLPLAVFFALIGAFFWLGRVDGEGERARNVGILGIAALIWWGQLMVLALFPWPVTRAKAGQE
ncbi:hypothetical protein IV417_02830 [Alphaproteobacteria bacterium KMM 3653]|uniref:Uncharacterized protein n=1 Tax=Harenicola maris TaxID=2841044 RepID=A0AAP2CMJ0_9RHOB|nr:hypothetical protein [Harenicola maris]